VKLVSWNVSGIRAVIGKGFHDFLAEANADAVCLQETKAASEPDWRRIRRLCFQFPEEMPVSQDPVPTYSAV
jgi:exonuclease III